MTVVIEVYLAVPSYSNNCTTVITTRNLISSKKICVSGVFSQTVKVYGQFNHDKTTQVDLIFKCPDCRAQSYCETELKCIELWDFVEYKFSDEFDVSVEVDKSECAHCHKATSAHDQQLPSETNSET